jgi:hypothetical protein
MAPSSADQAGTLGVSEPENQEAIGAQRVESEGAARWRKTGTAVLGAVTASRGFATLRDMAGPCYVGEFGS